MRLALERQGWQVVFANDIDPKKAEMYRRNWPDDDHLLVGDVHALAAADVPDCALATASFPCNDLSLAGRCEGLDGKHSSAFWGLVRVLREMGERRPRLLMIENVVGFLISREGRDLEAALLALNELGYAVDAVLLNASHWTPQSRRGCLFSAVATRPRSPAHSWRATPGQRRCWSLSTHMRTFVGICDVPPLPRGASCLADVLEDLPEDDPHWWNEERTEYLMRQMSPRHAVQAQEMIAGESIAYATAFRRVRRGKSMAELRTDGIAGCLRTPRGGSGRQILFRAGKGGRRVRLLTAREWRRLQVAPDDYIIEVPLNQALFGFGDAVCVPAVEWVVRHWLAPAAAEMRPMENVRSPLPLGEG